jgi:hypothetical protein
MTFHTSARPGRPEMGPKADVPDHLVHEWVRGLPTQGRPVTILSLLGHKDNGKPEWTYYSFYRQGRSFQAWLDQHYSDLNVSIIQHPTIDGRPLQKEVLEKVATCLSALLCCGQSVVLMDSGGVQRVGKVCKHVGATRD